MKLKLFEELEYKKIENKDEETIFVDGYLEGFHHGWKLFGENISFSDEDELDDIAKDAYFHYKRSEDNRRKFDPSQLRIPYTQDDERWNKDDSHLKPKNK